MILGLIDEAVTAGARQFKACEIIGLTPRTLERWREQDIGDDGRVGPRHAPANKLSAMERSRVLAVATGPEFRDVSPKQIVPRLADQGLHLGSESTFYRLLREQKLQNHREPSQPPTKRHKPQEQVAAGPNEVWSWDITYLRGPVLGVFFYFYVVMDVWSRKIVAWTLEQGECALRAQAMIEAASAREGVQSDQLVLHSDNGGPMKAATFLAYLQKIGMATSFSRPSVSNDNSFSESLFRTAKYRPEHPSRPFESHEKAIEWATSFVDWYNTEHRHSSINFVTPDQRHTGEDVEILALRGLLYEEARALNPKRWTGKTRNWDRVGEVALNPADEAA